MSMSHLPAPQGEDIVSNWEKRLPLVSLMSTVPRGRTVKALREKVERLAASAHTHKRMQTV